MHFSNLSASEEYRLNGTLSRHTIESLLDTSEALEGVEGVTAHLDEALGCYPGEDCLTGLLDLLFTLSKRLRGDNKDALLNIIEQTEDLQQCLFNQGDYGRSELREALNVLNSAGL